MSAESWHEVAARCGLAVWLNRIAIADEVTPELLAVVASTVDEGVPIGGWSSVNGDLDRAGLLERTDSPSGSHVLAPAGREAMLAALRAEPGGLAAAKAELVQAGIVGGPFGFAGQLSVWARELREWEGLERIWLRFPFRTLLSSRLAHRAYAELPEQVRRTSPVLGHASAIMAAAAGSRPEASLDICLGALINDGWTLHGQWRLHSNVDSAVAAGTMRLLAESSLMGSTHDPRLEIAWETALAVQQVIVESLRAGRPPSPMMMSFFHSAASSTAVLRCDWAAAKRHAQIGMTCGPECDLPGLMAAGVFGLTSLMAGSPTEYRRAIRAIDEHADHDCPAATWVRPVTSLPRVLHDTRRLARRDVETQLPQADPTASALRWFNYWPLQIWVGSFTQVLWSQPEKALAQFDAKLLAADEAGLSQGAWGPLISRARVELLLSMGAINRAKTSLAGLQRENRRVALVPTARLKLFARDFGGAAAAADEGLFSLKLPLNERAHLGVVKAASQMLAGAEDPAVDTLVNAACVVCEEAGTLLPFAMLPLDLRESLLRHHTHADEDDPCILARATVDGVFAELVPKTWWGNFPVNLTRKEQELLPLLAGGLSLAEIADLHFVSVNTLRKQEAGLRKKLGAHTRDQLTSRAHQFGLVTAEG